MTEFALLAGGNFWTVLIVTLCCAMFELARPVEQQGYGSRLRGLFYWAFYVFSSAGAFILIKATVNSLGWSKLVVLDLAALTKSELWYVAALGYLALPLPVLIADFCYYWFHRLQHAVPFLWRFHAVHHAIEEMNAANSVHHPIEEFFRISFLLPIALLVELTVPQVIIVSSIFTHWGQFVHSNTRVSLGPLQYVMVRPLFHRIHHSMASEHRNCNFASVFSLLDFLFRTAHMPRRDEVIRTGLDDRCEARTLWQYLVSLAPRQEINKNQPRRLAGKGIAQPRASRPSV